jgi:hypothetical protein
MTFDLILILTFITLGFLIMYLALSRKLKEPKTDATLVEWLKTNNQTITQTLQRSYQDLHAAMMPLNHGRTQKEKPVPLVKLVVPCETFRII